MLLTWKPRHDRRRSDAGTGLSPAAGRPLSAIVAKLHGSRSGAGSQADVRGVFCRGFKTRGKMHDQIIDNDLEQSGFSMTNRIRLLPFALCLLFGATALFASTLSSTAQQRSEPII